MEGIRTINGVNYTERLQLFPINITISAANQITTSQRLTFPGVAPFMLKALTRSMDDGAGAAVTRIFRFKFGTSEGGIWFTSAGQQGTNDRVFDQAMFGTGQFPYVIPGGILYGPTSSFTYEYEDIAASAVPYYIRITLHGAYLIQV